MCVTRYMRQPMVVKPKPTRVQISFKCSFGLPYGKRRNLRREQKYDSFRAEGLRRHSHGDDLIFRVYEHFHPLNAYVCDPESP